MTSKAAAPPASHPAFEAAEKFCCECSIGYTDITRPLRVEIITVGRHTEVVVVMQLNVTGYLSCKASLRRQWMRELKRIIAANGARMRIEDLKPIP